MQPSINKLLSFADVISLTNGLLGSFSIFLLFSGYTYPAFVFLLVALLADGVDGMVARKTKKGPLGMYFEAMADMVSLSIAPMMFVFSLYTSVLDVDIVLRIIFFIVAGMYLMFSSIRLASFHILTSNEYFVGLPVSAAMIYLVMLSFLQVPLYGILGVAFVVSLAMISKIRFPKLNLHFNAIAAILIVATILLGKSFMGVAPIVLLVALTCYIIGGVVLLYRKEKKK